MDISKRNIMCSIICYPICTNKSNNKWTTGHDICYIKISRTVQNNATILLIPQQQQNIWISIFYKLHMKHTWHLSSKFSNMNISQDLNSTVKYNESFHSEELLNIPLETRVFVGVRMVEALFGLFGNIMTLVIIVKYLKFSKNPYLLMFNLALNDVLISLAAPITLIAGLYYIFAGNASAVLPHICSIQGLYYTFVIIANFIVFYITTIDRYISIIYPIKYKIYFTRKRLLVGMVFGWLFLALWITVIILFGRSDMEDQNATDICQAYRTLKPQLTRMLNIFFLILYWAEAILYIRIVVVLRRRDKLFQNANNTGQYKSVSGKVARSLVTVVGTVLATHLPNIVVSLVVLRTELTHTLDIISGIATLIFFLSTLINPVIYYISISEYKEAFHKVLCSKPIRENRMPVCNTVCQSIVSN